MTIQSLMRRGWLAAAFFFTLTLSAQIQFEPDRTIKETRLGIIRNTILTVDDDAKAIIQRPLNNPNLTANAVKLFALIATDYQTTKYFQENIEPLDRYITPYISFPSILNQNSFLRKATGGPDGYIYFGFTAIYGAGLLTGNEKLQEAGILTTKAVMESYVVSHLLLKSMVGRHRPQRVLGDFGGSTRESSFPFVESPLDFFNWHINGLGSSAYGTGFPSYHATMYYTIASVTSQVFDNYWIPYTTMTLLWCYNIEGHNHWISEVVSGIVIGEFIGRVVYENYHTQRSKSKTTHEKKPLFKKNLSVGQTFGIIGPSLVLSW